MISWLIVEIGYLAISGPLERLNLLYKSDMNLITFSFQDFIILIAASTLLRPRRIVDCSSPASEPDRANLTRCQMPGKRRILLN